MQQLTITASQETFDRYNNPLTIRVLDDEEDECIDSPKSSLSPWPHIDMCPSPPAPAKTPETDARALFEKASAAFDQTKTAFREEGWKEDAPSKFDYGGKRNKKGMPDKRTAAGKVWFEKQRETELITALQKVVDKCNSWSWRGSK